MRTYRSAGTSAIAVALLALAGCTSVTSPGAVLATSAPESSASGEHAPPPATVVMATQNDNGRTITLATGQRLVVRLDSTYWTFAPARPPLRDYDPTEPTVAGSCLPGMGCGTVTAWFEAAATGRTTVTASRASCGEAMRCGPVTGNYRLTVIVR